MIQHHPAGSPWIDISLDALRRNLSAIRERIADPSMLIAVVKDNAYGCGAITIARELEQCGTRFFAVARISEAIELRNSGIISPIIVMGKISLQDLPLASSNNIRLAIYDLIDIETYSSNGPVKVHLKLDTGMSRLGLLPAELDEAASLILSKSNMELEGVFTHFACADLPDHSSYLKQRTLFNDMKTILHTKGLSWLMTHAAASSATFAHLVPADEWSRCGIALYGCSPNISGDFDKGAQEVLSLRSTIVKLKQIPKGTPVSYGWNWIAERDSLIATIPLGYGSGYPRSLGGRAEVLVSGKRCKVVGNITMDYIMVDVSDIGSVNCGDIVTAIGQDGMERITADDLAILSGTIGYEIITSLPERVPRFAR